MTDQPSKELRHAHEVLNAIKGGAVMACIIDETGHALTIINGDIQLLNVALVTLKDRYEQQRRKKES